MTLGNPAEADGAPGPPDAARGGRALVVEDDVVIQNVLADMLRAVGCTVTCACNAGEALDALLAHDFDLITLDYRLPVLSGVDLYMTLRSACVDSRTSRGLEPRKMPPILVVTAWPDEPEVSFLRLCQGVVGVVPKTAGLRGFQAAAAAVLSGGDMRRPGGADR